MAARAAQSVEELASRCAASICRIPSDAVLCRVAPLTSGISRWIAAASASGSISTQGGEKRERETSPEAGRSAPPEAEPPPGAEPPTCCCRSRWESAGECLWRGISVDRRFSRGLVPPEDGCVEGAAPDGACGQRFVQAQTARSKPSGQPCARPLRLPAVHPVFVAKSGSKLQPPPQPRSQGPRRSSSAAQQAPERCTRASRMRSLIVNV